MQGKQSNMWKCIYFNVFNKMRKRYPSMSEEGLRYRSWKATNKICRSKRYNKEVS